MEKILGQTLWMLAFYFCISVTLLFLGWILYWNIIGMHIPPGISQGTKLRLLFLSVKTLMGLGTILDKLGICPEFAIWSLLVDGIPTKKPSDLIVKEVLFDRVPVEVCCPKGASPGNRRGLVWIHGGAGLLGHPRGHRRLCHFIARKTDTVVVLSGYPLAPEHPFPAQQLSCYTAISHFLKNAQDYGVDPKRIVLAGDSSGGTLVASTAQQLVMTKDVPRPRAQVLLYPFLQCLDFNLPSYQQNHFIPLLLKKDALYLGTGVNEAMANAHIPQEVSEMDQCGTYSRGI